jgi:protein phosphatase
MPETANEVLHSFELAALSSRGSMRPDNEDFFATSIEDGIGLVVVADGVSGLEGGEVASRTAVEATLTNYREQSTSFTPARRLYRAVQQANIAVYDLAVVVPELRGMATTLTGLVIEHGQVSTMHVGDCRLYLMRDTEIRQLTKDHTVAAQRARLGLVKKERLSTHPDRSILTRNLGRELIAAIDQITTRVIQGDVLLVCSDGLYNVLEDREIAELCVERSPTDACESLIARANERGTPDNLTAAVVRITGACPPLEEASGIGSVFRRLFR